MDEKLVEVRGNELNVKYSGGEHLPLIVLLHGFTGSVSTWDKVVAALKGKFQMIAVDLTGHGNSDAPKEAMRYSMEEQTADLEALFDRLNLKRFTLVGYSMGGRIALSYTIRYPERIASLILESSSPGLRTEKERVERRTTDENLAQRILSEGMVNFVDFWENIPLFATQRNLPAETRSFIRQERLSQNPRGLANSLLGVGTGKQPSYWNELMSIQAPVLFITGENDEKFVNIAQEMKKEISKSTHETVKNVGHAIHVEKPSLFATIVEKYMNHVLKNEEVKE